MKKLLLLSLVLSLVLSMNSCMITKTSVGNYTEESPQEKYTYAKGKQLWVLWGLIPLGRTNVNTPKDGNCQVITKKDFVDYLIDFFTGGIVTSQTIKVKAERKPSTAIKNTSKEIEPVK